MYLLVQLPYTKEQQVNGKDVIVPFTWIETPSEERAKEYLAGKNTCAFLRESGKLAVEIHG